MRLTQQQREAHLWGAANILRGKTAGQDYKKCILSLMFYKRLCDQWQNEADVAIAKLERQQGRQFTDAEKAGEPRTGCFWKTEKSRSLARQAVRHHPVVRLRWGNCSALGNLSFNWRSMMAPDHALHYNVTHQMVHLAIPDHSKHFWLTVQSLCPQADRARQGLVVNGHRLTVDLGDLLATRG